MQWIKKVAIIFTLLSVVAIAGRYWLKASDLKGQKVVVIGGKSSVEQGILVEIAAQLIERHTCYHVIKRKNLGKTPQVFSLLKKKKIDMYCEYLGMIYLEILKRSTEKSLDIKSSVEEALQEKYGIRMLSGLGFANQYVLVLHKEKAERNRIFSISDLVLLQKQRHALKFGFDSGFAWGPERRLFEEMYTLELFKKNFVMQHDLLYSELRQKKLDVAAVYSTDASLISHPLAILEDDLKVFPNYEARFLVREEIAQDPQLIEILESLSSLISHDEIQVMNYQVEKKQIEAYKVARNFLISKKLI